MAVEYVLQGYTYVIKHIKTDQRLIFAVQMLQEIIKNMKTLFENSEIVKITVC